MALGKGELDLAGGAPVSLAGRPAPGPVSPGQAPVLGQKQARIHEAIEVECRELTADPDGGRGLVASDRLVPGDDELVQAAPCRLGEHCRDLDRVDVGESVGHGGVYSKIHYEKT